MPVHDAYARITPYELLLPSDGFAEERFPLILKEVEERGGSVDTPESFILLGEAALILREIRGEEDSPKLIQEHGALLFHAFHFWQQGHPFLLLETDAARFLVGDGPREGEWLASLPGRAGYFQLPHHLFWVPGGEGDPTESVDGICWSAPDGENLSLLIVMGIRKGRPGLAVVPLPTLPLEAAAPWASIAVRQGGEDFQSSLPGAELEGLHSIEAGAEAVKLVMRIFWYLDSFPGRMAGGARSDGGRHGAETVGAQAIGAGTAETERAESDGGPMPSRIPYRRIVLGDG